MQINEDAFKKNGFISIENVLHPDEISRFELELGCLAETIGEEGARHYGVKDEQGRLIYLNRLDVTSDYFFDIVRDARFLVIAEKLLGKAVIPLHVECFIKPPRSNKVTPPHQDQVFYQPHFQEETAISIWISLDDATVHSGALEYIPAPLEYKHLLEHKSSGSENFDYELQDDAICSMNEFCLAPISKGGCVIHHSYIIHRAGPNITNSPRRAIVFNYRGSPWRQSLIDRGIPLVTGG